MLIENYCFVSNYMTHHQLPFCLEMMKITGGNFVFIETASISLERTLMGYKEYNGKFSFILKYDDDPKKAQYIIDNYSFVIFGDSKSFLIKERMRKNRITFRCSERFLKKTDFDILRLIKYFCIYYPFRKKELYFLFCSAFASDDYGKVGISPQKMFKWGYFPETILYDLPKLLLNKEENSILWAGRLIKYKHPEYAVRLAKELKTRNIKFKLRIIGSGPLEKLIKRLAYKYGLVNDIEIMGSVPPEVVRKWMEVSDFYIFTSDRNEGWGAVLNEALNSACSTVVSDRVGSSPFLLQNGYNGYLYKSKRFKDFLDVFLKAYGDTNKREIQKRAYETIINSWNSKAAASRFVKLSAALTAKEGTPFENGVCSAI